MTTKKNRLLPEPSVKGLPISALAPMQDVTTLDFMTVLSRLGAPDYFFTEFFRVHEHSTLESHIVKSITDNPSGRPVFAQIIGECLDSIERTVVDLLKHPVAGIDLNLGCPAPKVYNKNVGGGLLRDPARIDRILGCLRACTPGLLTVKMRVGFECTEHYDTVLELINKHEIDLLSVHGRTVKQLYRGEVAYDLIARAAGRVACPVLANGNITSAEKAREIIQQTGVQGIMIGRSAIRNPWIFRQFRETMLGQPVFYPTLRDVRDYVDALREATFIVGIGTIQHASRMKKLLNFVGQGVDEAGDFLKTMRRAQSVDELLSICDRFLSSDAPFAPEPYEGVIARPNCEV